MPEEAAEARGMGLLPVPADLAVVEVAGQRQAREQMVLTGPVVVVVVVVIMVQIFRVAPADPVS